MQIKEITASDTLVLRNTILRPNFSLEECHYPGDDDATTHHFGCFLDTTLVGIISIYCHSNSSIDAGQGYQIRAMASSEEIRGKGFGLRLLQAAEKMAFESGADYIWANARVSAIGFYQKSGYKVMGNEFTIEGVGNHVLVVRYHALK